jgi:predicted ester cyclase
LRIKRCAFLNPKEIEMGSKVDLVKAYYDKAWSNPPASLKEAVEIYFSDDYKSFDKDGNVVMTREAFVGMSQLMLAAFKDFKVVYGDIHEESDGVVSSYHFEGTHTGPMDLSAMGLGVIPPSGKKIVWPEQSSKWKVEGGKIVSEVPVTGGMEEFLAALGVKLPSA